MAEQDTSKLPAVTSTNSSTTPTPIAPGTRYTQVATHGKCFFCGDSVPLEELWTNGDNACEDCMHAQITEWKCYGTKMYNIDLIHVLAGKEKKPFRCWNCKAKLALGEMYEAYYKPYKKGGTNQVSNASLCGKCASETEKMMAEREDKAPPKKKHKKAQ